MLLAAKPLQLHLLQIAANPDTAATTRSTLGSSPLSFTADEVRAELFVCLFRDKLEGMAVDFCYIRRRLDNCVSRNTQMTLLWWHIVIHAIHMSVTVV